MAKSTLLFAGLGDLVPSEKQAFEFGELGAGAFAGVYLGDVVGSLMEGSSWLNNSASLNPAGKMGQLAIAAAEVLLGGVAGYHIAKRGSRPLGYGFGAGMIGAGLNRAIVVAMNGSPLPGVKPWAFQPSASPTAGAALPGSGVAGFLGAAPVLVNELSGAPVLVNELNGVGDPDDANLPFLA